LRFVAIITCSHRISIRNFKFREEGKEKKRKLNKKLNTDQFTFTQSPLDLKILSQVDRIFFWQKKKNWILEISHSRHTFQLTLFQTTLTVCSFIEFWKVKSMDYKKVTLDWRSKKNTSLRINELNLEWEKSKD